LQGGNGEVLLSPEPGKRILCLATVTIIFFFFGQL